MKFNCPEELAITIADQFDDVEPEDIHVGTWSFWCETNEQPTQMKVSALLKDGRLVERFV